MNPTIEVPSVTRVEVDDAKVRAFEDEHAFTGLAGELLIEVGSGYRADLEWHRPRPQLLSTLAHLTMKTLNLFFSHAIGEAGDEIAKNFPDLENRIALLVHLHEEFLAKN